MGVVRLFQKRKGGINMKKFNKQSFLAAISTIAVFVAAAVATSACIFWTYQPEEPESLRDE